MLKDKCKPSDYWEKECFKIACQTCVDSAPPKKKLIHLS